MKLNPKSNSFGHPVWLSPDKVLEIWGWWHRVGEGFPIV